ncbi:MAG: serine/threonine-protein kinase [Myxococcota bacterium]
MARADYEILERIGAGGMAEVFRARRRGPQGFERLVALKRIHADVARDESLRAMFIEEARVAASLCHRSLVQVFDFGEEDGDYFLAMELVDGVDLAHLLSARRRLPPPIALYVAAELCEGLAFMHERGIVHRDVNPGNTFVSRAGEVKLGDFGIAKARARAVRTERGHIKGKLGYLAPEQARGEEVDGRTDVYGVGLILFEMLTGRRYIAGESEAALLYAACAPPVVRPTEIAPDLDARFDALCARFLAVGRDARFPSARIAADAVAEVAAAVGGLGSAVDVAAVVAGVPRGRAAAALGAGVDRSPRAPTAVVVPRRRRVPLVAWLGLGAALAGVVALRTRTAESPSPHLPPMPSPSPSPISSPSPSPSPSQSPLPLPVLVPSPNSAPSPKRRASPPTPAVPVASPPSPSPSVVQALLREARELMHQRGLLSEDAPEAFSRWATLSRDLALGQDVTEAARVLRDDVASIAIDRGFVERKLARLDRRLAATRLRDDDDARARSLARAALDDALDGRFVDANRRLNDLDALLTRSR